MISSLLKIIEKGIQVMKAHTNLLFIGVLVFVFPLVFLYISEQVHQAAFDNIQTVEKRHVGILHDSIAALLQAKVGTTSQNIFFETIISENQNIREIRVVRETPTGYLVVHSFDVTRLGTQEKNDSYYESYVAPSGDSLIFPSYNDQGRVWEVVRKVEVEDETYFILSIHSFGDVDRALAARKSNSYFQLSFIFIFLLSVAYWLSRQINWHLRYTTLQSTLKERDLFTNMIAHEFRSPLTVINGYISFLKESKALHPAEQRFVENIDISAHRLLALVNDFLDVARIQSGKLALELKDMPIAPVIQKVIDDMTVLAVPKGLSLTFIKPDEVVTHTIDEKRFYQILQNLITNAIKYTEAGHIEVHLQSNSKEIIVRIKDTGMGISAEDQQKLFQPFARVGTSQTTTITGTGLGMWITKEMTTLMNGSISLESIKEVGTHITVTLRR